VPAEEVVEALGVSPEIVTAEGVFDVTKVGRPEPGAPFEASQAGRGTAVREYLGQSDVYFAQRGLVRVKVPDMTVAARGGVGFVKVGGFLFMLYGAYRTAQRIEAARGTAELPVVVAEEAGGWTGGILGSALGGAAGGAIFCAPGGPIDLICVAGGFLGGLIVGALGGHIGAQVGHDLATLGGTPCPSCHAMQRAWEQRQLFPDFGALVPIAPKPKRLDTLGLTPPPEVIEQFRKWEAKRDTPRSTGAEAGHLLAPLQTPCPSCHGRIPAGTPPLSRQVLTPEEMKFLEEWVKGSSGTQ